MCLESLKFWNKHKRRDESSNHLADAAGVDDVLSPQTAVPDQRPTSQVPSSRNDPNVASISGVFLTPESTLDSSRPALSTDVTGAPPTSLSTAISSKSSSGSLLERLWNEAYAGLESDEKPTVEAYEKLLVERLKEINTGPIPSDETRFTTSTLKQPDQLEAFVAAGLEQSKKIAATKKNIEEFARIAKPVKAAMDVVVQAAPQAALAWSCISFTLQILANPLTESSISREGITYVLMTMKWYLKLVYLLEDDDNHLQELRNELERHVVELYKKLLLYQMKSVCCYYRRQIYVFFRDLAKFDDWAGKLDGVKNAEEDVRTRLDQYRNSSISSTLKELASTIPRQFNDLASAVREQTRTQQEIHKHWDREHCLRALRQKVDPHDEKDRIQADKGGLLRDSYSWILDHESFKKWSNNEHKILWITGDPGKGKTMLLCGIIDELEKEPTNTLSYFFCQATQTTLSNATAVIRGLIYGLAKRYRHVDRHIYDRYKDGGGEAVFEGQSAWHVMCGILKAILNDPVMDGVLLIVDALDECLEDRQKLLDFICMVSVESRAKWAVSSRNWQEIEKAMGKVTEHTSTLPLELNDLLVTDAVRKYIRRKMEGLAEEVPFKGDRELCNTVTDYLEKNSGDTFLWVALVCNALHQSDVCRPEHILGPKGILKEFPKGLDNLYDRMLAYITGSRDADLCKDVLAVASVLQRHVTTQELCSIMGSSPHFDGQVNTLNHIVRSCGSFLNLRDETIYFVHQSARDFLHNNEKAFHLIFPWGIKSVHEAVCLSSLDAASRIVHRDIYGLQAIYGLKALGKPRGEFTSPQPEPLASINYACIYWMDHLSDSEFTSHIEDGGVVHQFLQDKFLYWLEALALLRQLPQAVQGIQKLQRLVDGTASPVNKSLSEFIYDANRFLLYHRVMIENTPLQLYASALVFSPEHSIVRQHFWHQAPKWVTVMPGIDTTWDMCLQTLFGHQRSISTMAYSLDGQWLISGSRDGIVKLWHVDSGTCVHTLGDHDEVSAEQQHSRQVYRGGVLSVVFSVDGQSLVSAYEVGFVKVWDRVTGNCIRELRVHAEVATHMAISTDGCTIASSLVDGTMGTWNIQGETPLRTFATHTSPTLGMVDSVVLTADGQWLASTFSGTIQIWDTVTRKLKKEFRSENSRVKLIFSAEGQWVASAGYDVRVWESATGKLILTPEHGFENIAHSPFSFMAFSADRKALAASHRSRLYVWNTMTSALIWKSDDCGEIITSLLFSPDAQRLVSATLDKIIKVWDLPKGNENASGRYFWQSLCYSDEHHFAACYLNNQKTGMWFKSNSSDMAVKLCHEDDVSIMGLSKDHKKLASASIEGKITIWDTKTGTQMRTFRDYEEKLSRITSLVFRDNLQLAAGGFGTINIWNTSDGTCTETHDGESYELIYCMTFSTDGRWLAYISSNRTTDIRLSIWDTATGECFPILSSKWDATSIASLSFSADSRLLAWALNDTIRLWDMTSGTCKQELRRYGVREVQVSFDANIVRRLHTQFGFLDLIDPEPDCLRPRNSESDCPNSQKSEQNHENASGAEILRQTPSFRGYGFSYDLEWIVLDGHRLLQIPLDYRADKRSTEVTPVVNGSTLIWISKTGRLVRMHFTARG